MHKILESSLKKKTLSQLGRWMELARHSVQALLTR